MISRERQVWRERPRCLTLDVRRYLCLALEMYLSDSRCPGMLRRVA